MDFLSLFNKSSMEFISVCMFHIIGSISPTPYANGIALMVLVYYSAKISGGHLNPAVSLTFFILGHINIIEFFAYIFSQFTGAMVGALMISALVPSIRVSQDMIESEYHYYSGCFSPNHELTHVQVFFWEFVFTTMFIIPIFSVVWYTQHKSGYGNTGPIMVGLSLLSNALACGPFTGASLNPARSLGSYTVFKCQYKQIYTYIFGEFLGGICAAMFIMPWYGISINSWYKELIQGKKEIVEYLSTNSKREIEYKTV